MTWTPRPLARKRIVDTANSNEQICHWHPAPDTAGFLNTALDILLNSARAAITARGQFHLVLAGGTTPERIYRALQKIDTDWSAWHIYFGDERCLPADDTERNSTMAKAAWLDQVPIPPAQIHLMPGEQGAVQGALSYARSLRGMGSFDLVLLGLGEDAHTASLFPGHDWGMTPDAPDTLAVLTSPKPPPERISLSAARLSRSRQVLFLVSGLAKRPAVAQWLAGADIPARSIRPPGGVDILIDSALLADQPTRST